MAGEQSSYYMKNKFGDLDVFATSYQLGWFQHLLRGLFTTPAQSKSSSVGFVALINGRSRYSYYFHTIDYTLYQA